MATMPRVREIEELCRKAQMDPRITQVICMLAERQRVQHQQLYEVAQTIVAIQELLQEMLGKVSDIASSDKSAAKDTGVHVESVEEFDEDNKPTNFMERK